MPKRRMLRGCKANGVGSKIETSKVWKFFKIERGNGFGDFSEWRKNASISNNGSKGKKVRIFLHAQVIFHYNLSLCSAFN